MRLKFPSFKPSSAAICQSLPSLPSRRYEFLHFSYFSPPYRDLLLTESLVSGIIRIRIFF
nr:MAG TPA: hypothetical protein [Bacteriophage sp.]